MQKEMVPVRAPFVVDFGAQAPDLLTQLDRFLPDVVHRDAARAYVFLAGLSVKPAEEQADVVSRLGLSNLTFDRGDMDAATIAVLSAALSMVRKAGRTNPSQQVADAMRLLADRYHADL